MIDYEVNFLKKGADDKKELFNLFFLMCILSLIPFQSKTEHKLLRNSLL